MTIKSKAIMAAICVALSPSLASAQGFSGWNGGILDLTPRGHAHTPLLDREPRFPNSVPHGGHAQGADECGAARAQNLIGVNANALYFPGNVRIIAPGTAVARDHRPDRMNVRTDHSGHITSIYCG